MNSFVGEALSLEFIRMTSCDKGEGFRIVVLLGFSCQSSQLRSCHLAAPWWLTYVQYVVPLRERHLKGLPENGR